MDKFQTPQRMHPFCPFGLALIWILITTSSLLAQDLTTIKAPGGIYADKIQGYAKGDSLFMMYSYRYRDEEIFETLVITSGDSISELSIPLLHHKLLLGAFDTPYNIYFYILHTKAKKDLVVKAIIYDKRNRLSHIADWEADIPDHPIGIISQNDLTIAGVDEAGNAIGIVTIDRLTVKRDEKYIIDSDVSLKKSRHFGFVAENMPVATADAAALKKIFLTQKAVFITENRTDVDFGSTKILRIDRATGRKSRKTIFEKPGLHFGNFIHDEQFYHVVQDRGRGFEVRVYDTVNMVSSFKLDKQSDYIKAGAWLRNDIDLRVLKRTVLHVIDGKGQPYVIFHTGDSARQVMELGMHQEGKKQDMTAPIAGGVLGAFNPALGLIAQSAILAGSLATDPNLRSLDKYFYLQKDHPKNGFVFCEKPDLVKQQIDDYDSRDPKITIWDKVYIGNNNVTYGIYRLKGNQQELRITRFQKGRTP
jgi:hypothetical protein